MNIISFVLPALVCILCCCVIGFVRYRRRCNRKRGDVEDGIEQSTFNVVSQGLHDVDGWTKPKWTEEKSEPVDFNQHININLVRYGLLDTLHDDYDDVSSPQGNLNSTERLREGTLRNDIYGNLRMRNGALANDTYGLLSPGITVSKGLLRVNSVQRKNPLCEDDDVSLYGAIGPAGIAQAKRGMNHIHVQCNEDLYGVLGAAVDSESWIDPLQHGAGEERWEMKAGDPGVSVAQEEDLSYFDIAPSRLDRWGLVFDEKDEGPSYVDINPDHVQQSSASESYVDNKADRGNTTMGSSELKALPGYIHVPSFENSLARKIDDNDSDSDDESLMQALASTLED